MEGFSMTAKMKSILIERLTVRFENITARAAAVNEVITADKYAVFFDVITRGSRNPLETLYRWAVARGEIWNYC